MTKFEFAKAYTEPLPENIRKQAEEAYLAGWNKCAETYDIIDFSNYNPHDDYEIVKAEPGIVYAVVKRVFQSSCFLEDLLDSINKEMNTTKPIEILIDYLPRNGKVNRFASIICKEGKIANTRMLTKDRLNIKERNLFNSYYQNHPEIIDNSLLCEDDKEFFKTNGCI